jgi:hypothetical protein
VMKINLPVGNPFWNSGTSWLSLFQPLLKLWTTTRASNAASRNCPP